MDHHSGGAASIASSTAATVNARRRVRTAQRNGAARYLTLGKLRRRPDVAVIIFTPRSGLRSARHRSLQRNAISRRGQRHS